MNSNNDSLLHCSAITKSFSKNKVLRGVELEVKKGEVHALLGANGAGKSTLVKIITGVYSFDGGDIFFDGNKVEFNSAQDSESAGIAIIHQDPPLVPSFDVTRNAFLGSELTNSIGLLDMKSMRKKTQEMLNLLNADFTADRLIKTLNLGQKEQVAIVSALLKNPKLLILDEPTATLSDREITKLFEIIDTLKSKGVTIIYISHLLDEIFQISDSITVLRDGINSGTLETSAATKEDIIRLMTGKEIGKLYPKEHVEIGEVALEVENFVFSENSDEGISFNAKAGEILGFAGLVGAGRTEAMLALYGAENNFGGKVKLFGKDYRPATTMKAKNNGFAFVPEDRRGEGMIASMNIRENISLANMRLWSRFGLINRRKEKAVSQEVCNMLGVVSTGVEQMIRELSGGNQQKVIISRWLTDDAKVFIFDQPTTGVDVGAKTEIYKQMISLAKNGAVVLFISSEFEELMGICDRILVMSKNKIVKELEPASTNEQEMLLYATSSGAAS